MGLEVGERASVEACSPTTFPCAWPATFATGLALLLQDVPEACNLTNDVTLGPNQVYSTSCQRDLEREMRQGSTSEVEILNLERLPENS